MTEGEIPELREEETANRIEKWGYDTRFKYYLLRIAILGNEGAESIDRFPEKIELDDAWHNTLDRMRDESRDGIERGIPVGFKEDKHKVFLPMEFWLGTGRKATVATLKEAKENSESHISLGQSTLTQAAGFTDLLSSHLYLLDWWKDSMVFLREIYTTWWMVMVYQWRLSLKKITTSLLSGHEKPGIYPMILRCAQKQLLTVTGIESLAASF